MDKIVSFIILAYNVEQYLEKCLNSFLCPDVMDQVEVIVIDDGSSDRTAEIADSYVEKYPHVFRVIHKENGGHGSGINVGSQHARGKYLKAIDADDWVVTDNLPGYVNGLKQCSADVVLTPYHMVDMNTGEKESKNIISWDKPDASIEDIINNRSIFEDCCVFHGITYRTDFYRESGHELPEHIFYEDQEYSAIPFCKAEKIAIFNIYLYQYLVGNAQQSVAFGTQAKRIGHLERVVLDMIEYYRSTPNMKVTARNYLLSRI